MTVDFTQWVESWEQSDIWNMAFIGVAFAVALVVCVSFFLCIKKEGSITAFAKIMIFAILILMVGFVKWGLLRGMITPSVPSFDSAISTAYGFDSADCSGRDYHSLPENDTKCVVHSQHGKHRETVTVHVDSKTNRVSLYDSDGNIVQPVRKTAPNKES